MSGLQLPEDAAMGGVEAARSLSVCQTTTYRWSLADDLAAYVRAGIGGIGLYRPKLEEIDEDTAIDLVRASGLAITSLSWVGGFTGSDGSSQAESLFDAGEALRLAAAVDARAVVVVSGGAGNHITKHARRLLTDALTPLCELAGDLGVKLALHPFSSEPCRSRTVLTTLDETLDAVDAVGDKSLGIVFDVAELGREPRLLDRIPEFAPFVSVVKVSDRRPSPYVRRRLGEGAPSVAAVVRAFVDAGYDGSFEFDLWSDRDRSADEYKGLLAACRSRFESFGLAADVGA